MPGAYEGPEFQNRLQAAIDKKHKSLAETLSKFCPVDAVELRGSRCDVCGRSFPVASDDEGLTNEEIAELDEPSPEAEQSAAKKAFEQRLEKQRAEREQQAKQQAKPRPRTHLPPEDDAPPPRNWEKFIDANGQLRRW